MCFVAESKVRPIGNLGLRGGMAIPAHRRLSAWLSAHFAESLQSDRLAVPGLRFHQLAPLLPARRCDRPARWWGGVLQFLKFGKKQGATGNTPVAPYVAGQWGRGNNRLPE
jgi:hypothetical protein